MRHFLKANRFLLLVILASAAALSLSVTARAQTCGLLICKDTPFVDDIFSFPVTIESGGEVSEFDLLNNGSCIETSYTGLLEVTEGEVEGFHYVGVECDGVEDQIITQTDHGFTAFCPLPDDGICRLVNLPTRPVPTLSEWGMIAAAAGLGLAGVFFAVRRKRLQVSNEFDI